MARSASRSGSRSASRSRRTPDYVRAAESFGQVSSIVSLIGGIFFGLVFIAVGVVVIMKTDKRGLWWGVGSIAVGAFLLFSAIVNRWLVKNYRAYAAYYGVTSGIGGLGNAIGGAINN
jgi:uncharacterized membrane protein (UPF0136 family)